MNNELLLLIKKHTDTLIEQTKTKPQETPEFVMNKQTRTYSFNPPINLSEEGKWFTSVTFFERSNSVFNITNETYRFQSLYQVIGKPNLVKKLLTNQLNY